MMCKKNKRAGLRQQAGGGAIDLPTVTLKANYESDHFLQFLTCPETAALNVSEGDTGRLNWPIENVIDLFPDVRSQPQELSIDPV